MKRICSFISLLVLALSAQAAQLPVFVPESVRVTNPTFELIWDMCYGKQTFALLESNQHAVIVVGESVRDVVPLPFEDARYIAYGNGVFVVVGTQGSVSCSKDLYEWEHFHYDGATIVPGLSDIPNDAITIINLFSLSFNEAHGHFFVETSNGQVMISQNGSTWSVWTDGDVSPPTPFPQVSDMQVVFEHEGQYLKFERENYTDGVWQVFQSKDASNWTENGQFYSSSVPKKAFYRNGSWLGMVSHTCFFNVGNKWDIEPFEGYPNGFPVKFSRGRYHHNQILGLRDGTLSEFSNNSWTALLPCDANSLEYLPNLNRFMMIDSIGGTVDSTYDGTDVFRILAIDGFRVQSIAENNHRLLVAGMNVEDRQTIWVSNGPIPSEAGLNQDYPVAFVDGSYGIDWTSFPNPEYPGNPMIVSCWSDFYLATGYYVYRSSDGLSWEKIFEADSETASRITALYTYRGQLWVATSNSFSTYHSYSPPPEGIDHKNALYSMSYEQENWEETVIDDQIHLSNPSLDGPYYLDCLRGTPSSTVMFAEKGDSIEHRWFPWSTQSGTFLWAYGRYYLFQGNSVAKTRFLGFEDAEFYRWKEELGDDYQPTIDTGYFGQLSPTAEPINHYTLGQIEVVEKPGTDGVLSILSERWGVLEMNLQQLPYAYSPIDETTYYVNFHAPSGFRVDNDSNLYSPFYNHATHEWGQQLSCEFYNFDQWYGKITSQLSKVESLAAELIQFVSTSSVADAHLKLQTVEAENKILKSLKWPSLNGKDAVDTEVSNERNSNVDAALRKGQDAVEAARQAYELAFTRD